MPRDAGVIGAENAAAAVLAVRRPDRVGMDEEIADRRILARPRESEKASPAAERRPVRAEQAPVFETDDNRVRVRDEQGRACDLCRVCAAGPMWPRHRA